MDSQPSSFAPGSTIGDYQIVEVIGLGRRGKVFKVSNVISDRVEAMKVLLPTAGGTGEPADRFVREIKAVAGLEHPDINSLRTALRVHDQIVMIMEHVEGASLDFPVHRPISQIRRVHGGFLLGIIGVFGAEMIEDLGSSVRRLRLDEKPLNMFLIFRQQQRHLLIPVGSHGAGGADHQPGLLHRLRLRILFEKAVRDAAGDGDAASEHEDEKRVEFP